MSTFSSAFSLFSSPFSIMRKQWFGWMVLWVFIFVALQIGAAFVHASNGLFFFMYALFQGAVPFLLFYIYRLNQSAVQHGKIKWFPLVKFELKHVKRLSAVSLIHIIYPFIASITAWQGYTQSGSADAFPWVLVYFILNTAALIFTWSFPASIAEGATIKECAQISLLTIRKGWKILFSFLGLLHTPTILTFIGGWGCTRFIMENPEIMKAKPDIAASLLWDGASGSILLILFGLALQSTFWMIFLIQAYGPQFFEILEKHNNEKTYSK